MSDSKRELQIKEELSNQGLTIIDAESTSFQQRLKDLMSERNLTIKDLKEMTGVSYPTAWNWIQDDLDLKRLRKSSLEKLSKCFGVSPDYLLCKQADYIVPDEERRYQNDYKKVKDRNTIINLTASFCKFITLHTPYNLALSEAYATSEIQYMYKGFLVTEQVFKADNVYWELTRKNQLNFERRNLSETRKLSIDDISKLMENISKYASFALNENFESYDNLL